jgi:hypothetical protein
LIFTMTTRCCYRNSTPGITSNRSRTSFVFIFHRDFHICDYSCITVNFIFSLVIYLKHKF